MLTIYIIIAAVLLPVLVMGISTCVNKAKRVISESSSVLDGTPVGVLPQTPPSADQAQGREYEHTEIYCRGQVNKFKGWDITAQLLNLNARVPVPGGDGRYIFFEHLRTRDEEYECSPDIWRNVVVVAYGDDLITVPQEVYSVEDVPNALATAAKKAYKDYETTFKQLEAERIRKEKEDARAAELKAFIEGRSMTVLGERKEWVDDA